MEALISLTKSDWGSSQLKSRMLAKQTERFLGSIDRKTGSFRFCPPEIALPLRWSIGLFRHAKELSEVNTTGPKHDGDLSLALEAELETFVALLGMVDGSPVQAVEDRAEKRQYMDEEILINGMFATVHPKPKFLTKLKIWHTSPEWDFNVYSRLVELRVTLFLAKSLKIIPPLMESPKRTSGDKKEKSYNHFLQEMMSEVGEYLDGNYNLDQSLPSIVLEIKELVPSDETLRTDLLVD
jgi:hypothetical protein